MGIFRRCTFGGRGVRLLLVVPSSALLSGPIRQTLFALNLFATPLAN
jgi:hypothetical protein